MSLKIKSITLIQHFTAQALRLRWLTLLAETALNLFVKVVDEDDVAIEGVDVDVVSDSGQTNTDGELELYAVPGQENTVTASHNGYVTQQIILPAENVYPQQLNIQMIRSRLELKVVNNQNEPIEGATCRVLNAIIESNNVLSFDGVDDYVDCGNLQVSNSKSCSWAYWFKTTQIGNARHFLSETSTASTTPIFILQNQANKFRAVLRGTGGTIDISSAISINDGDWHYLAATIETSGTTSTVKIYVDGSLENTGSGNVGTVSTNKTFIGKSQLGATSYFGQGQASDVRMWNVPLSVTDLHAEMNKRLIGTEANLVRYWKLDEGEGVTTKELIGNIENTIFGATWQEADESFPLPIGVSYITETPYDTGTTNANGLTTLNYQINRIHGLEVTLPGKRRFIMPFERTTRGLLDWQVMLSDYLATFATDRGNILINSEPENNDATFLIE